MKKNEGFPRLPARIACWVAAFLLTAAITMTVIGSSGLKLFTSDGLYSSTAAGETVLRTQMERINGTIDALAAEYGFSAEKVKAAFPREELEELNRDMAEWWSRMMEEGASDSVPEWSASEIEGVITESMIEQGVPEETAFRNGTIVIRKLEEAVQESSLPLRGALISRLFEFINKRIRWEDTILYLQKLPGLGIACCLLLGGLIALLCGKKIRLALKYFGAAAGGAGICLLFAVILVRTVGISGMISQASAVMAEQYGMIAGRIRTECLVTTGALLTAGFFCLYLYGKKERNPVGTCGEEA